VARLVVFNVAFFAVQPSKLVKQQLLKTQRPTHWKGRFFNNRWQVCFKVEL